jgi:hypothetical protein
MTVPDFFPAFAARVRPPSAQLLRSSVGGDGDRLRALLASRDPRTLSPSEIRTVVESNLWMLAPDAFRYFLPAFLHAAHAHYDTLSVFASELIGALTPPNRDDVVQALDTAAKVPAGLGLTPDVMSSLREQQLAWFDSGTPEAIFQERFAHLTAAEGAAILGFFAALRDAHGADFFGDLELAIERYWARYTSPR